MIIDTRYRWFNEKIKIEGKKEKHIERETYSIAAWHSFWPFTIFECVLHITRLLLSSFLSSTRTAQIIDFIQKGIFFFFCLFVRMARTWCVSHKIAREIYVYTHVQCVLHTYRKKTKCERSTSHHSRNVFEHTRTMIPLKSFIYMVHFFEASRWGYRWKILRNTIFTDIDLSFIDQIIKSFTLFRFVKYFTNYYAIK